MAQTSLNHESEAADMSVMEDLFANGPAPALDFPDLPLDVIPPALG